MRILPRWLKLTFLLAVGLLVLFWSLERRDKLAIFVKETNYQVFYNGKQIANHQIDKEEAVLQAEKVTLRIKTERDSFFLPSFFRKQKIKFYRLEDETKREESVFAQKVKVGQLIKSLFDFNNLPFTGQVLFSDAGFVETYSTADRYKSFKLEAEIVNPVELQVNFGKNSFWIRPLWHHENILRTAKKNYRGESVRVNYQALVKAFVAKIVLNILSSFLFLLFTFLLVFLLSLLPIKKMANMIVEKSQAMVKNEKLLVMLLFFIFLLTTIYVATTVLEGAPHSQDEVAYLFQAKIFALGKFFVPSLPEKVRRFFDHEFIINNGQWFGAFPPGNSLFLALGQLVDAPYIINPLFSALSLLVLYFLTKDFFSKEVAFLTSLFFVLSPFYILQSSSLMSHPVALFFTLLFIFSLKKKLYLRAGLSWGMLFVTRPYTAVLIATLPGFFIIWQVVVAKNKRKFFRLLILFLIGVALPLTFEGFYNKALTGSFFTFPYSVYSSYNKVGFGIRGNEWGSEFTPFMGLENTIFNFYSFLDMILPWQYFFVFLFVPFAFVGKERGKSLLFTLFFLVEAVGYSFYFAKGTFYGPRFWYETSFVFFILTSLGIISWYNLMAKKFNKQMVLLCLLLILILLTAYSVKRNAYILSRHQGYNGMYKVLLPQLEGRAVVFISSDQFWYQYGRYFIKQSPLLNDRIIFARDEARHNVPTEIESIPNKTLIEYFSKRKPYILVGSKLRMIDKRQD